MKMTEPERLIYAGVYSYIIADDGGIGRAEEFACYAVMHLRKRVADIQSRGSGFDDEDEMLLAFAGAATPEETADDGGAA